MNIEAAAWRTSSYSVAANNECVEVAPLMAVTAVRDTKARGRGHLEVAPESWNELLAALRR